MSLFPKFIVAENEELGLVLIIAKCRYHKELIKDLSKIKGGGWWRLNNETKTFIFSGDSHDFGKAKMEDIQLCVDNGNVFTNSSCRNSISDEFNFLHVNETGETTNLKNQQNGS